MNAFLRHAARIVGFAGILLASTLIREGDEVAVRQAVVWLPTGVAIVGVWWLGWRALWAVAVAITISRIELGYPPLVVIAAGLGSVAEAAAGVAVLRMLALDGAFGRLRDALALILTATVAPLASIAFSALSRQVPGAWERLPFYSGWDGWWRMNALGALTVIPLAGVWLARSRASATRRVQYEGAAHLGLALLLTWAVISLTTPGPTAILLLLGVLPVTLVAALRCGQRWAVTVAAANTLFVTWVTTVGLGPFLCVPFDERHVAAQVFALVTMGVPLVIGSLIAERERDQRLLAWQAEILELIATDRPDQEVFSRLVGSLEDFVAPGIGSLLLLQGEQLRLACAPNLPGDYNRLIDGLTIGPHVGCCGAAAHGDRTVVAADTLTHPNWSAFRFAATRFGLRACWSVPVRAPGGAVVGTFAIYHERPCEPTATEIAYVERAAVLAGIAIDRSRRESLLTAIHRNVQDGIYRTVPGQGLVYANDAFARAFGYDAPAELLAAVATRSLPPGAHADDLARFAPEAGQPAEGEQPLHRRDGTLFWARLSRTIARGPDGAVVACDGAMADITLQRQLAEQLRQAQKMEAIGKLAGGIAHDFNNLLTAIGGCAEGIRDRATDAATRAEASEALEAVGRAAGLTRRLLAFSRQQVLAPQVCDLGAIVDGTAGMLRRLIGEHIRFVTITDGGPWPVLVDKGQIEQVLLNLALNARDAMPDGGTLEIAVDSGAVGPESAERRYGVAIGTHAFLTVRDTGVGMDEVTRSRAFEPFFTTKAQGHGTGLGLATVYGIVRQSDGVVWIDSAPGHGTTVHICLPRAAATPRVTADPHPTVCPPTGHARILLAEDEDLVRDLLLRVLTREGHRVTACRDGAEALAAAGEPLQYDLLITDTVMPNVGGKELARRLQARSPGLPVLLLSGYASDGAPPTDGRDGPTEFLPKPFVTPELLAALARLRARASAPTTPAPS